MIITIDLNDNEKETLRGILKLALCDLREEIVKTESSKWKLLLHDQEDTFKKLIEKLS